MLRRFSGLGAGAGVLFVGLGVGLEATVGIRLLDLGAGLGAANSLFSCFYTAQRMKYFIKDFFSKCE